MIVKPILITNNPKAYDRLQDEIENIEFVEGGLLDVMIVVRDYIHKGYKLLTHPLMGSIKPNETPYKSVAISLKPQAAADMDSVMLIENSIETATRLIRNKTPREWPESILEDFSLIDYDLIKNALIK
ncbi:MAG: GrdX family protein [Clostridium sp.]|uniref:GrdX family protein n=1 Tax=Clostridium sp. TaxID=1506 RepID=UPI002FC73604